MNEQYCDQCPKRCSVDALHCNKGRAYFGLEPAAPHAPIGLLQRCGSVLHHGGISPENALSSLTQPEQAELERLLSTLLADWQKHVPEGQYKHRRSHS